jgi:hypothetical protein
MDVTCKLKKIHRTVKHIYFLPTLKPTKKKIKELALPHHHPNWKFQIISYICQILTSLNIQVK